MKKIKLTLAVMALAVSSNAYAMPDSVPDRYYDQMYNWVKVVMGLHRRCVGPTNSWC